MDKNRGIIYILTDELFKDNVVKIGKTEKDLKRRVSQLGRGTEVPCPFECYSAYEVDQYDKIEKIMHTIYRSVGLQTDKEHKRKEFFYINPQDADAVLNLLADLMNGKRVKLENTPEEKIEIEDINKKIQSSQISKKFKFEDYDIPVGAELVFIKDKNIKCQVGENNKVIYKNQAYNLSPLTLLLMSQMGYSGKHYNGYMYWLYQNVILSDYRDETDE